jgi:hypothetical protein
MRSGGDDISIIRGSTPKLRNEAMRSAWEEKGGKGAGEKGSKNSPQRAILRNEPNPVSASLVPLLFDRKTGQNRENPTESDL